MTQIEVKVRVSIGDMSPEKMLILSNKLETFLNQHGWLSKDSAFINSEKGMSRTCTLVQSSGFKESALQPSPASKET